jgi:hypothetical protein
MADPFGNLSPEDYAQQQQINRQQQMASLLMQQNQQPQGQMVSGRYVAPSFFQNLQPIANMLTGAYLAKQGDTKAQALAEAIRGREAAETQKILGLQFGSPDYKAAVMPQIQRDDMGNVMPAVEQQVGQAPNQKQALVEALKSQGRTGQMIGQTLLAQKLKPPEQFNLREGEKRFTYNPDTGATTEIAKGNPKEIKYPAQIELALALDRSLPRDPATWTQADADKANLRIEKHIRASAPNMTSINNVMAFEPFANKVQSKMGEGLVENYANLKNIPSQIKSLDRAAQLAPKSFAGSMAEQKLGIAKFFNNNLGTNISGEKVKNTEELRSALFTNVMENLKKLDASPSQQQQQILQQSMGSIGTDPNAIPLVVNTYKQILIDKAKQHNLQVRQAQEGPAKLVYPYDISIPLVEGTGEWRVK